MTFTPRKSLGQHFLVDENILAVIGRLARLQPDDVVLEVGPGLGVLTRYLAEQLVHLHAAEVDRRLEPQLATIPNAELHWGDALQLDITALTPPPNKLVANLPYNIATPLVVESLAHEQLALWCVMVQREVADRFFAVPSTKAYGAVSVLVQLATRRTGLPPGLPGGLQAATERRVCARRLPSESDRGPIRPSSAWSKSAFGHRRKTLANSLSLGGVASREQAVAALAAIGREPNVRAEELAPHEFAGARGGPSLTGPAPAKINLALVVGPLRADGKHELVTVYQRLDLSDRVTVEPAAAHVGAGFAGDAIVQDALAALGAPHGWRIELRQADAGCCRAWWRELGRSDGASARERAARATASTRRPALTCRGDRRRRPLLPRGRPAARNSRRHPPRAARPAAGLHRPTPAAERVL